MSATISPQVGGDFGDYRIDALLGRGAMGVVYRAWQRRMNRAVALKVLPADLAGDPQYRSRFVREAAALARLDSPHVIQIYDHGELDGNLYLAMQLVPGPDLGRVIESGALSPRRALRIAEQVAAALGDGHAAGVVHRDVKPSNVLMRPRADHDSDGEDGDFVYLCDFGIARSAADLAAAPETVGIVGTLGYLAPERLRGKPASPASDVYSLGCLLWALLVGSAPYQGSQPQVIMSHLQAPVRSLDGPDHRTTLVNGLLRGTMAKDPAQRPTIATVRRQIRQILDLPGGTPLRAGRVATLPDDRPPRRRRRGWVVAAAGLAVVLVAVLGWTLLGEPGRTARQRLAQVTPVGADCRPTAVPRAAAEAGGLDQLVCDVGDQVGQLRLIALARVDDTALGRIAGQDVAALPEDGCPVGLPAREPWPRDDRRGTLVCLALGPSTRYAWSFEAEGVVAVLDGAAQDTYPSDLAAVEEFFNAARYPD